MNSLELPPPTQVKSIACLMLGEIGDILVCTPTISALRVHYPDARIVVIMRQAVASLLQYHPAIDAIHLYHAPSVWQKMKFLFWLCFFRCDLWMDLHTPTFNTLGSTDSIFRRNALMLRCARTRFQVGFAVAPLVRLLSHPVAVPARSVLSTENIVDTTLRLVGGSVLRQKSVFVGPDEKIWADNWLKTNNPDSRPMLGLFFGAKQPAKFWPMPQVIAFVQTYLCTWPQHLIVLFGGQHEEVLAQRIFCGLSAVEMKQVVNSINKLSLLQTASLLQSCDHVVSTDSGPMHLADALGVPLIALMSSHNYLPIWRPISIHAHVLNVSVPCGPCFQATCNRAELCMKSISPDSVMSAIENSRRSARVHVKVATP